jgi:DNA-binding NarL/FixJ family response regulator
MDQSLLDPTRSRDANRMSEEAQSEDADMNVSEECSMGGLQPFALELVEDIARAASSEAEVAPRERSASRSLPRHSRRIRNQWSPEEIHRLRTLAATGAPTAAIAHTLRRTESAVKNKAFFHGISLRPKISKY